MVRWNGTSPKLLPTKNFAFRPAKHDKNAGWMSLPGVDSKSCIGYYISIRKYSYTSAISYSFLDSGKRLILIYIRTCNSRKESPDAGLEWGVRIICFWIQMKTMFFVILYQQECSGFNTSLSIMVYTEVRINLYILLNIVWFCKQNKKRVQIQLAEMQSGYDIDQIPLLILHVFVVLRNHPKLQRDTCKRKSCSLEYRYTKGKKKSMQINFTC